MAKLKDNDLDSMADHLLSRAHKIKRIEPPVDLFELAKIQRVTAIDFRPMIPTGGLSCRTSGFVIYLQDLGRLQPLEVAVADPVEDRPRLTVRQRFTFAHELAHTLLFSASDPPQLRDDAPIGSKLEGLCHRAARRLLMPASLIAAEITKRGNLGSRDILDLARRFDVSPEVALWRCHELASVRDSDRALLFVRRRARGDDDITGFYCSKWFQDRKGPPEVGMRPSTWLSGLVGEEFWNDPVASSVLDDPRGRIVIRRVPFQAHAHFVELERFPPEDVPPLLNQPTGS